MRRGGTKLAANEPNGKHVSHLGQVIAQWERPEVDRANHALFKWFSALSLEERKRVTREKVGVSTVKLVRLLFSQHADALKQGKRVVFNDFNVEEGSATSHTLSQKMRIFPAAPSFASKETPECGDVANTTWDRYDEAFVSSVMLFASSRNGELDAWELSDALLQNASRFFRFMTVVTRGAFLSEMPSACVGANPGDGLVMPWFPQRGFSSLACYLAHFVELSLWKEFWGGPATNWDGVAPPSVRLSPVKGETKQEAEQRRAVNDVFEREVKALRNRKPCSLATGRWAEAELHAHFDALSADDKWHLMFAGVKLRHFVLEACTERVNNTRKPILLEKIAFLEPPSQPWLAKRLEVLADRSRAKKVVPAKFESFKMLAALSELIDESLGLVMRMKDPRAFVRSCFMVTVANSFSKWHMFALVHIGRKLDESMVSQSMQGLLSFSELDGAATKKKKKSNKKAKQKKKKAEKLKQQQQLLLQLNIQPPQPLPHQQTHNKRPSPEKKLSPVRISPDKVSSTTKMADAGVAAASATGQAKNTTTSTTTITELPKHDVKSNNNNNNNNNSVAVTSVAVKEVSSTTTTTSMPSPVRAQVAPQQQQQQPVIHILQRTSQNLPSVAASSSSSAISQISAPPAGTHRKTSAGSSVMMPVPVLPSLTSPSSRTPVAASAAGDESHAGGRNGRLSSSAQGLSVAAVANAGHGSDSTDRNTAADVLTVSDGGAHIAAAAEESQKPMRRRAISVDTTQSHQRSSDTAVHHGERAHAAAGGTAKPTSQSPKSLSSPQSTLVSPSRNRKGGGGGGVSKQSGKSRGGGAHPAAGASMTSAGGNASDTFVRRKSEESLMSFVIKEPSPFVKEKKQPMSKSTDSSARTSPREMGATDALGHLAFVRKSSLTSSEDSDEMDEDDMAAAAAQQQQLQRTSGGGAGVGAGAGGNGASGSGASGNAHPSLVGIPRPPAPRDTVPVVHTRGGGVVAGNANSSVGDAPNPRLVATAAPFKMRSRTTDTMWRQEGGLRNTDSGLRSHLSSVLDLQPSAKSLVLSKEIRLFVKKMETQVAAQRPYRELAISKIRDIVRGLWPQAHVEVFGSYATDLCLPSSDIDLVVVGAPSGSMGEAPGQQPLGILTKELILDPNKWFAKVQAIPTARIPIIKFIFKSRNDSLAELGDIPIDITFTSEADKMHSGVAAREFVKQLVLEYRELKPLAFTLKQFLVQRGLSNLFSGGISSYCLVLMIATFLSCYGLDARDKNVGALLCDFLELFGKKFDFSRTGISMSSGSFFELSPQFAGKVPLWIDDPFNPGQNIGFNSFAMYRVKASFEMAFHTLNQPYSHGGSRTYLGRILSAENVSVARNGAAVGGLNGGNHVMHGAGANGNNNNSNNNSNHNHNKNNDNGDMKKPVSDTHSDVSLASRRSYGDDVNFFGGRNSGDDDAPVSADRLSLYFSDEGERPDASTREVMMTTKSSAVADDLTRDNMAPRKSRSVTNDQRMGLLRVPFEQLQSHAQHQPRTVHHNNSNNSNHQQQHQISKQSSSRSATGQLQRQASAPHMDAQTGVVSAGLTTSGEANVDGYARGVEGGAAAAGVTATASAPIDGIHSGLVSPTKDRTENANGANDGVDVGIALSGSCGVAESQFEELRANLLQEKARNAHLVNELRLKNDSISELEKKVDLQQREMERMRKLLKSFE